MSSQAQSARLVAQMLQSADEVRRQALASAFQRYRFRILSLLQARLPSHLRHREDAEDLAQSAWATFVRGVNEERIDLEGRSSLWPLLAKIALCKQYDLWDRYHSQKRDITRERSLQAIGTEEREWQLLASGPSPEEEAAAEETVQLIHAQLADDRQRHILALHLEGFLIREISDLVKVSPPTVKRVLERIRDLYKSITNPPPDATGGC